MACPPRMPALAVLVLLTLMPAWARAEAVFRTEPYLLDPQPHSVVLMFELDAARAAEVTLTGPEGERVVPSPAVAHHLLRLEGLLPDTEYAYAVRVLGPDRRDHRGTFRTPRTHDRTDARICLYGDSRSGEPEHRKVVAALRRTLAQHPAEAVVHLGDFATEGGELEEWLAPFESVAPLAREVPLLFVLGNHELLPDDTGRPHYERFFGRAFGEQAYYVRRFGPLHLVVLDTNTDWPDDEAQLTWAREQLASLRAAHPDDFILLLAHHPMFSGSLHEDHMPLREALEAAAREHADLVFGGHDHTYERGTVDGLHYIVSGGGGSPLYEINHRRAGQLAYVPEYHFLCLDANAGQLTLQVTRMDGSPLEQCTLRRGQPFVCADGTPRGVIGGEAPWRFWMTSRFLWRRLGPALALLALLIVVARNALARRRDRRE
jgi:predicted MPP superfamily phosphohydrolase